MQVDFYQLTRDPAEKLVPVLAQKTLDAGKRLLIVSDAGSQREALSKALWEWKPESFLAHANTGESDDSVQPILISGLASATNDASYLLIADGKWRGEVSGMERIFYLFQPEHTDDARSAWRALGESEGVSPKYWRQDGGRWVEGP
ncbi:MAG: DNA polymerase III subunit chi [Sphingorhabdus sp.]